MKCEVEGGPLAKHAEGHRLAGDRQSKQIPWRKKIRKTQYNEVSNFVEALLCCVFRIFLSLRFFGSEYVEGEIVLKQFS